MEWRRQKRAKLLATRGSSGLLRSGPALSSICSTQPAFRGAVWAADTYAAPWLSLIANFAGSVLLLMFVRRKRVRRSTKIATAVMLSAAWLCTLIAFLVVE